MELLDIRRCPRGRPAHRYLAVQAIFDGPPDVLTVHAALVARRGRGVLIAGVPEAGKSTLACALWQHGFSLLGDDVAIVDLEQMTARPAPRRVSLRRTSRALLGDDLNAYRTRAGVRRDQRGLRLSSARDRGREPGVRSAEGDDLSGASERRDDDCRDSSARGRGSRARAPAVRKSRPSPRSGNADRAMLAPLA